MAGWSDLCRRAVSQTAGHEEVTNDRQLGPFLMIEDVQILREGELAFPGDAAEAIIAVVPAACREVLHQLLKARRVKPHLVFSLAPGNRAAPEVEMTADSYQNLHPAVGKKRRFINVIDNVCRRYSIQPATENLRRNYFKLMSAGYSMYKELILLYLKYIIYE